jgi:hypothetical protein
MLTKEISEVEKGCGKEVKALGDIYCCGDDISIVDGQKNIYLCQKCELKLSTLKSAQQKFDKFKQKIKELLIQHTNLCIQQDKIEIAGYLSGFHTELDELSSKQEEDEISLCKNCYSMTKTIKGKCGKCGGKK